MTNENDLVMMTVSITLEEFPGTWWWKVLSGTSRVRIWDNPTKQGTEVPQYQEWDIDGPNNDYGNFSTSYTYWVEGIVTSASPADVKIRTRYDSNDGNRFSQQSVSNTVFDFWLEPIMGRVTLSMIKNPCGLVVGDSADWWIAYVPASLVTKHPSVIQWSCVTGIAFNGSAEITDDTGCTAGVEGGSAGFVRLRATIEGFAGPQPTIDLEVFASNKVVSACVTILATNDGTKAWTEAEVEQAITEANTVFSQVGIEFVRTGEVVTITNVALYHLDSEAEADQLFATNSNTGGMELYFVRTIASGVGWTILDSGASNGIAVSHTAEHKGLVLAHELGHSCNLEDVFSEVSGFYLEGRSNAVSEAWIPRDWNGGPGPLYYRHDNIQEEVIGRLLMEGASSISWASDIPLGCVWGMDTNLNESGCMVNCGMYDSSSNAVLNRVDPHH